MKLSKSVIIFLGMLLTLTACSKKPVTPTFELLAIDTLIGSTDNGYRFGYRFATIANAKKSASLKAIEKANIEYFFELEDFGGSALQAADATIAEVIEDLTFAARSTPSWGLSEISVESEGALVDTLVTYIITRASFMGGAHDTYCTECHTYSLAGGYELSAMDLFTERQLVSMQMLLRKKLYRQYNTESDEGLAESGFFPEYIAPTENFQITGEGITFHFNPYEIGSYALGAIEVTISREELANL